MNNRDRSRGKGVGLVIIAAACWSTSGVWVKFIVEASGISAIDLAFWRDLATFVTLLAGVSLIRPSLLRVRVRDLPLLALMGGVGMGVFHVLWNLSTLKNGAAIATILQYNSPIIVSVFAWLLWRESLTWRKILAVLFALVGTILVAWPNDLGGIQVSTSGLLVGLASAAAFSIYTLAGKRLADTYNSWTVVTYVFAFATLALLPFALFSKGEVKVSPLMLGAFAGFVFIPTIGGYFAYTLSLQGLQASVAAIVATIEVLFVTIWAYLLLGEQLDSWKFVGMALVVAGVILVSLPRRYRLRRPGVERIVSS
ncbi:MAG TPA: EamA family transporter [Caldilineae bacterium]|nr:EamA family transporter [Caldilineae bacterium]